MASQALQTAMPTAMQTLNGRLCEGLSAGTLCRRVSFNNDAIGKAVCFSMGSRRPLNSCCLNSNVLSDRRSTGRRSMFMAAKLGDADNAEGTDGKNDSELDNALDKVLQTEESKALLEDLSVAMARVEAAKKAMEELEQKEKEASNASAILERIKKLEDSQKAADKQVEVCEGAVESAEAQLRASELKLVQLRAGDSLGKAGKWDSADIDEDVERVESGKAAAVSAVTGAFVSLPFALASSGSLGLGTLVSEATLVVSCALFGVCYRYIVRRDIGNTQLKGGAVGAFSLTRGLAQLDTTQLLVGFTDGAWEKFPRAALDAGESVIIFAFAGVALDYCMRQRLLEPFPSKKQ